MVHVLSFISITLFNIFNLKIPKTITQSKIQDPKVLIIILLVILKMWTVNKNNSEYNAKEGALNSLANLIRSTWIELVKHFINGWKITTEIWMNDNIAKVFFISIFFFFLLFSLVGVMIARSVREEKLKEGTLVTGNWLYLLLTYSYICF